MALGDPKLTHAQVGASPLPMSAPSTRATPADSLAPGRASGHDYIPGLDGLRAFAIAAVVLYHADVAWLPGGFLGVEIFLVISGYLITALLRSEYRRHGTVDITDFWLRRARRLLPAMWVVIFSVTLYVAYVLPDELATLRGDAIAALGYAANWVLIFDHKSYFEQVGRPSLLKHFWSLAIEQQFYLFWPGIYALVFARLPRVAASALLACAGAESALWMAALFNPELDPSRLYFGTDTRASGLLLGAALAMLRPSRTLPALSLGWRRLIEALGALSLGLLIAACFFVDEYAPQLYRGGFFGIALSTVFVVAGALLPGSALGRMLSAPPLRWLGVRSYSLYLWHFPIFMVMRPELDMPLTGWPALALRLALALACAELSYRYVETPVRNGALVRIWNQLRTYPSLVRSSLVGGWVAAIAALCVAVAAAPKVPTEAEIENMWLAQPSAVAAEAGQLTASTTPAEGDDERAALADAAAAISQPLEALVPAIAAGKNAKVLAIGDSVMLGAARYLREPGTHVVVDAVVGRQASATLQLLEEARRAKSLPPVVLIHIGNNGTFRDQQFDKMMAALSDVQKVVFVNTKVPRRWQDPNNTVLTDGVRRHRRAQLVDWHDYSRPHPEWFRHDGYHLQPSGARAYASLLRPYYANAPQTASAARVPAPM